MSPERATPRPTPSPRSSRPWWAWGCGADLTARDRRRFGWANFWLVAWAIATVLAYRFVSGMDPVTGVAGYVIVAVPILLGLATLWSFCRFLRDADELLRKIQLEALSIGAGVGLVFLMSWQLLEKLGAPEADLLTAAVVILLAIGLGQWLGTRRYA